MPLLTGMPYLKLFRSLKPYSVRAVLRLDHDDAIGRRRAVDRCARGALHDLDRLDVQSAELVEAADIEHHAVDDEERLLAASLRVDRRRTAEHDLRRRAWLAARRCDA